MKIKWIIFVMILCLFPALCIAGNVVVISNSSVPENTLNSKDLSSIYLGKKSTWSDGSKIVFVVLKDDACASFYKDYVGKSESQFNTYWKKQVFTGKGKPPREFDSAKEMVDFVAATKGAIGYVPAGTGISKVKNITIK